MKIHSKLTPTYHFYYKLGIQQYVNAFIQKQEVLNLVDNSLPEDYNINSKDGYGMAIVEC